MKYDKTNEKDLENVRRTLSNKVLLSSDYGKFFSVYY